MASEETSARHRLPTLQITFTVLSGLLLLTFLVPLLAFLPDVEGGELARQIERAGLARSVAISGASATLATLLAALGGVPLGYLLARDRIRSPWLVRTVVLIPLVLPPVAAGVLLLNVYGPGGAIGRALESAGWTFANAFGGIVIAQVFITAPFVIVTAEAAFRAVDARLEAVGATLGRSPGDIFRRISLPLARYGLLAGLALAWMRAAGEFGATVVLAYHPRSLPVHLWVELAGRGLRAALPVTLVALALAAGILVLAQRLASHNGKSRGISRLRGPASAESSTPIPQARIGLPKAGPRAPAIEAHFTLQLGDFTLAADLEADEEILSLFGPSGAGKSTLLRAIAGLTVPDAGHVRIDGATVFDDGPVVPPEERPVGLVFQEPSLFPHMSVEENILFAAGGPGARDRLRRLLAVTRLEGLENRYPDELSGGQQQRAALARALMRRPRVLLLDEPFSSLDTNMRERLHRDVKRIQAAFGLCVIYVTHELRDACAMGDRIAVIGDGRIEQVGEPLTVIRHPATYDVARFVGVRNLFEGVIRGVSDGRALIEAGGLVLEAVAEREPTVASRAYVCVRPEDFQVERPSPEREGIRMNCIRLAVRHRLLRGATLTLEGAAAGTDGAIQLEVELPVRTYEALDLALEKEVTVVVDPEAVHLIPEVSQGVPTALAEECDDGSPTVVLTAERRVT